MISRRKNVRNPQKIWKNINNVLLIQHVARFAEIWWNTIRFKLLRWRHGGVIMRNNQYVQIGFFIVAVSPPLTHGPSEKRNSQTIKHQTVCINRKYNDYSNNIGIP